MDKHIVGIESDEWVGSASEFILKYDIPMDWDVYGRVEDGCRKFVAVTGPHSQKYDESDEWEHLGEAWKQIDDCNTENLCIDERLINGISDDQWDMWDCSTDARVWGVFNGNPAVFTPGDFFNRYLLEPLFLGKPEMAWARLFPQLLRELEDIGFSPVYCEPNVLTKFYKLLGSETYVRLVLDKGGFHHFVEFNEETFIEFDLESVLNPDNDSTENSEELIRFVCQVSEKILEFLDELSE